MIRRTVGHLSRRALATGLVSALSLALLGGFVVISTTSLGCGAAAKLGLKGISSSCKATATVIPLQSPSPSPSVVASPDPGYQPPVSPPVSAPYVPPASTPYPPVGGGASGPYPPAAGPDSSPYPPYFPPAPGAASPAPTYPLSCKLPVYTQLGQLFSGGFIEFPAGNFVADPASAVSPPAGLYQVGLTYDRAFSRWVPVTASMVSPDGSHYAYLATGGIWVVTVATGARVNVGQDFPVGQIVSVGDQGVYAVTSNGKPGLWLVPFSGAAQQVTASGSSFAANANYAYGTDIAYPPGAMTTVNTINQVDLKTGAVSPWFTRDGAISYAFGADDRGNVVILVNYLPPGSGRTEMWVARGPAGAYPVFGTPEGLSSVWAPVGDAHGLWFLVETHTGVDIYLFVPGSGLYFMSRSWPENYEVAGPCG